MSLLEAADDLRRPFTADALGWMIASGSTAVCFIDRALVVDRLNLVVPHLWSDAYEQQVGHHLIARLTIGEVTRQDIGKATTFKPRYSDALKRVAVKFGIGAYLPRVPSVELLPDEIERGRVNAKGLKHCRRDYTRWLRARGIKLFGEPLDQGDTELGFDRDREADDAEPEGARDLGASDKRTGLEDRIASLLESATDGGFITSWVAKCAGVTETEAHEILTRLTTINAAEQTSTGTWRSPTLVEATAA